MRCIFILTFTFITTVLFGQINKNSFGIGVGLASNKAGISGYNFNVSHYKYLNHYLSLETSINHSNFDNFPNEIESGTFGNNSILYGEYESSQITSLNFNINIMFINNNKHEASLYTGPSFSAINEAFYLGTDLYSNEQSKGDFYINKEKYYSLGLNYGLLYNYVLNNNYKIGVKMYGFSTKTNSNVRTNPTVYSLNLIFLKKI